LATAIIAILAVSIVYVYYSTQNSNQQTGQITITDDQGTEIILPAVPQRIVSLAPSVTPILYEIGVGDKVVGLTEYDDYPYNFTAWFEAGNMTKVGGFSTPSMEAIASVNPDIIFTTNVNEASIPNMRQLGYKVVVVGPTSIEGIYKTINLIGKATGAEASAASLVDSLKTKISGIESKIAAAQIVDKPTVYYEVWYDSSGVMSAGAGSWINDVINKAGGINIFADETQEYPTTSSEVIVQKNPDVVLLPTGMGTGTPFYGSVDEVKARPGWSAINGIKNDRLYVIDQDLFSEPGMRVADQVEIVAKCLYPQLFTSP
jgi:iron complex transport system substrate-binding protein